MMIIKDIVFVLLLVILSTRYWMRRQVKKAIESGEDIAYTLLVINYTEVEIRFSSEHRCVQINFIDISQG